MRPASLFLIAVLAGVPLGQAGWEMASQRAGMIVNKNGIPNDPRPPMVTSGLRLGTPALTTRGLGVAEMEQVAAWLDRVMDAKGDGATCDAVRSEIRAFCERFPLPH